MMRDTIESIYKKFKFVSTSTNLLLKTLVLSSVKIDNLKIQGESLFILGNGPSLKNELKQFKSLSSLNFMCVNFFANTELYDQLKPSYYILHAPEFWKSDVNTEHRKKYNNLFSSIKSKTTWEQTIFVSIQARNSEYLKLLKNDNIKVYFYNDTAFDDLNTTSRFLFRKKMIMPRPHNVMVPALTLCIWNKISNVFLLGVDHSWTQEISVDDQNRVLLRQKHFYNSNPKAKEMLYKAKRSRRLHEVLHKFYYTFKSYHQLESMSKTTGVKIVNLTENSFIDAFEKKSISEIR